MAMSKPLASNRYVIGCLLGRGGYGDVFQALDVVTKQNIAIKIMISEDLDEEDFIPRSGAALWEIEILSKLNHPNIIKLLDAYVHENNHHLIFESMATTLDAIISDPSISFSPADCKFYMQMLLQGIAYLHQNSIYHGDISAKNVMIGHDGQLKIIDFGSAHYYKPKKNWSNPQNDILDAAEIFAKILKILIGRSPHEDVNLEVDLAVYTSEACRELFPDLSEDGLDLLQQMFVFNREDSITAEQALKHRYFTSPPYLTSPPPLPTPASLLPRTSSNP